MQEREDHKCRGTEVGVGVEVEVGASRKRR